MMIFPTIQLRLLSISKYIYIFFFIFICIYNNYFGYLSSLKVLINTFDPYTMLKTEDFISHFAACSFGCQALAIICYVLYNTFGEGNGTPLQYFCLENPMDGGDWQDAVHGVAKSQTRLSDFTFTFHFHALEKEMATHSMFLLGESQGRGSMVGCHLWGRTESDTTEVTQQQQYTILYCALLYRHIIRTYFS